MIERFASTAGLATALCVAVIFLAAGLSKIRYRQLLRGVVANYRLLPDALVPVVAVSLPLVELAVGLALIFGERRFAPWVAIVLFLGFAYAMAVNIRLGRSSIDCGCGSPHLRQPLSWALVGRNVVLAIMLLPTLLAPALPAGGDLAVAIFGAVALYLFYHLFHAFHALTASSPALNAPV